MSFFAQDDYRTWHECLIMTRVREYVRERLVLQHLADTYNPGFLEETAMATF
jgi:hypothetical protein